VTNYWRELGHATYLLAYGVHVWSSEAVVDGEVKDKKGRVMPMDRER
jgi:hypothetical protein